MNDSRHPRDPAVGSSSPSDGRVLDELIDELADRLPRQLGALADDMSHNLRPLLHDALGRFDLVTREEFDAQAALLARARTQLRALEARLDDLENGASR